MTGTLQQRYLAMMARLYELAGTFSEAELKRLSSSLSDSGDYNALRAVELLSRLHNNVESGVDRNEPASGFGRSGPVKLPPLPARLEDDDSLPVGNSRSLERLLGDSALFHSVRDIADAFPTVELRPKEGRERYIRRVAAAFDNMSPRQRSAALSRLSANLAHAPEGFVSRWKKLIKDM